MAVNLEPRNGNLEPSAHNPKVRGSSPLTATNSLEHNGIEGKGHGQSAVALPRRTFSTEDCLNREQGRTHSPKETILADCQLPTLHTLILAEVFLAGGPIDIFRLWSEMYERQKTINVGLLLFTRAIMHLEGQGYLNKYSEIRSRLAGKGEMYLMGLLLCDALPEEVEKRFHAKGIQLVQEVSA